MQPIELPSEFQINPRKRKETQHSGGFIFKNLKDGKPIRLKVRSKDALGIPIAVVHDFDTNIIVVLSRLGTNLLLSMVVAIYARMVKRVNIPFQSNLINTRHILRFYPRKQKLIRYHEFQANIEIRSSVSLKPLSSFSLAEICREIGLSKNFSDLRTSIDLDYIPHLSSMILLLGAKIVLVPEQKMQKPSVIYNIEGYEKYRSIVYKEKQRVLLVAGMSSLLLMNLDNTGICQVRVLTSNRLCNSSKLLCWNPSEEIFLLSQRISQKMENYYILNYSTPELTHIASLLNIPAYGNYYDEESQTFFFIEGEDDRKSVSFIPLKGISTKFERVEKPALLEGECMVYVPEEGVQSEHYLIRYYKGTLLVKGVSQIEDDFTR